MRSLILEIEPMGKPSIRSGARGMHWPKRYVKQAERCRNAFKIWWSGREPLDGALALEIVAVKKRPTSLDAKRHPDGRIPLAAKPDADNISKAVCDALTSAGVIVDDNLIADLRVRKFYASRGEQPSIEIRIGQLEEARP